MFHTNVISFLAIGGLVCLLFLVNINAVAIQQVTVNQHAQNFSLLPMESLHMKNTEKKDKLKNPSLLPMKSPQIAKIYKNMSPFQEDKKLENQQKVKVPNDNENNENMKKSKSRLLPQDFKFNSQSSRTVANWPSNSYRKISENQLFPKFDRAKSPQINMDYYRPLSAYEQTYNLPPKLINNFRNDIASPEFDKDKEADDQHEITMPMSDDIDLKIQARANKNYYPKAKLNTVCLGKSTVYNKPRVLNWLRRSMYRHFSVDDGSGDVRIDSNQERYRPIWYDLRYQLFKHGRSEECHIATMKTWRRYSECALRRNQRMEYMIPKYPLHQMGYVFRWTTRMNEQPYNNYRSYIPRTDNWCLEHTCILG